MPNVFTGTDFLHRVNVGEKVDVGDRVLVIGGGDTAIDAARVCRRPGADVAIVYRRTRTEMPAIDEEIEGADLEDVRIDYLAAPMEIYTENGRAVGMKCQCMELGEPDSSGRRRPVPVEGDTFDMDFTCLIAAVSQAPDFEGFGDLIKGKDWIKVDEKFKTKLEGVYSGGDNVNLGLAIDAIAHGHGAAVAIHEMIAASGDAAADSPKLGAWSSPRSAARLLRGKKPTPRTEMPVEERLKDMAAEIASTYTKEEAIGEGSGA